MHHNPASKLQMSTPAPETVQLLCYSVKDGRCFPQQTWDALLIVHFLWLSGYRALDLYWKQVIPFRLTCFLVSPARSGSRTHSLRRAQELGLENQTAFSYPFQFLIKHPGLANWARLRNKFQSSCLLLPRAQLLHFGNAKRLANYQHSNPMHSIKYLDVFAHCYIFLYLKYSGCVSPSFNYYKTIFF